MNDKRCINSKEQSPLQAEGLGQIDVATRNAEIFRKCKEGYIHSQLSRVYSLSPEWIRRICEDEERKQHRQLSLMRQQAADASITVRDICNLIAQDSNTVSICDVKDGVETSLFEGSMYDASLSAYKAYCVQSIDLMDGQIKLKIETD